MKKNIKKVCVVGAGRWGKNHIRTLYNSGNLGGIVESDKVVLDSFKTLYPEVDCLTNIDEAITRGFDGFTVASPVSHALIGTGVEEVIVNPRSAL